MKPFLSINSFNLFCSLRREQLKHYCNSALFNHVKYTHQHLNVLGLEREQCLLQGCKTCRTKMGACCDAEDSCFGLLIHCCSVVPVKAWLRGWGRSDLSWCGHRYIEEELILHQLLTYCRMMCLCDKLKTGFWGWFVGSMDHYCSSLQISCFGWVGWVLVLCAANGYGQSTDKEA